VRAVFAGVGFERESMSTGQTHEDLSALREKFWRVVAHLILGTRRKNQLLFLSEHEARILYSNGKLLVVLLDTEEFDFKNNLDAAVSNLVRRTDEGVIDVLVVSDDEAVRKVLLRNQPPWKYKKRVAVYQMDSKGQIWKGPRSSEKAEFVKAATGSSPISQLPIADIQARAAQALQKDRQAISEVIKFQESFRVQSYTTTIVLAAVILFFFALEEMWGGSTYVPTLMRMGANAKEFVRNGEVWRLGTSIFLHAGFLHFFINTYVLMVLGNFFNRLFGGARFLCLFVVSGFGGSIASTFLGKASISVGASGALWGLFGASAALALRPSDYLPEAIRHRIRTITIINIVINLSISFLPMIDLWAHLGGGITGFLVGLYFTKNGPGTAKPQSQRNTQLTLVKRFRRSATNPFAVAAAAIIAVCFAFSFHNNKPWRLISRTVLVPYTVTGSGYTISIPDILMGGKKSKSVFDTQIVEFGSPKYDPMTVTVAVDQSGEFASLPPRLRILAIRRKLGLKSVRWTEETEIEGQKTLMGELEGPQNAKIAQWMQIRGNDVIMIDVRVFPGAPLRLTEGLGRIVESVKGSI